MLGTSGAVGIGPDFTIILVIVAGIATTLLPLESLLNSNKEVTAAFGVEVKV